MYAVKNKIAISVLVGASLLSNSSRHIYAQSMPSGFSSGFSSSSTPSAPNTDSHGFDMNGLTSTLDGFSSGSSQIATNAQQSMPEGFTVDSNVGYLDTSKVYDPESDLGVMNQEVLDSQQQDRETLMKGIDATNAAYKGTQDLSNSFSDTYNQIDQDNVWNTVEGTRWENKETDDILSNENGDFDKITAELANFDSENAEEKIDNVTTKMQQKAAKKQAKIQKKKAKKAAKAKKKADRKKEKYVSEHAFGAQTMAEVENKTRRKYENDFSRRRLQTVQTVDPNISYLEVKDMQRRQRRLENREKVETGLPSYIELKEKLLEERFKKVNSNENDVVVKDIVISKVLEEQAKEAFEEKQQMVNHVHGFTEGIEKTYASVAENVIVLNESKRRNLRH